MLLPSSEHAVLYSGPGNSGSHAGGIHGVFTWSPPLQREPPIQPASTPSTHLFWPSRLSRQSPRDGLILWETRLQRSNSETWPRENETPISKRRSFQKQLNRGKDEQDSFSTNIPSFKHSSTTNPAWQFQSYCRRPSNKPHLSSTTNSCVSTWWQLANITSSHGRKAGCNTRRYLSVSTPTLSYLWPYFQRNRSSGTKGSLNHPRLLYLFVLWSDLLHLLPSLPCHLHRRDWAHSEGTFWWTSPKYQQECAWFSRRRTFQF